MNIFAERINGAARAVRESPAPDYFTMAIFFHDCGTPACVLGHYVVRPDLQLAFGLDEVQEARWRRIRMEILDLVSEDIVEYDSPAVCDHFDITQAEAHELFGPTGCNRATHWLDAAEYLEAFARRKWPEEATLHEERREAA